MGVGRGRPAKLTRTVQDKVCQAIRYGAHPKLAADYARIGESTLQLWLSEGRKERERLQSGEQPDPDKVPFLGFLTAVEEAEAEAGISWLEVIDRAASENPEWAWRMLKLRFPQGFLGVQGSNQGITQAGEESVIQKQGTYDALVREVRQQFEAARGREATKADESLIASLPAGKTPPRNDDE